MNERIEAWKAQEKLRTDIGWVAVLLGIAGGGAILVGILGAIGADERPPPIPWPLVILLGIVMLVCAVGLWNVRPWARWVGVAYFT